MGERTKITAKTPESRKESSVFNAQKPDYFQSTGSPIDNILFFHRSIGNQAVQRLMQVPKKHVLYNGVIQLQTDPTPPKEVLEERRKEGREEFSTGTSTTEEIGDTGEGVASIEEGMPFMTSGKVEEKKEERPETSPLQAKTDNQSVSQHEVISPDVVLDRLDGSFPMDSHLRGRMEEFFGEGFSSVKLHTGQRANTLAASLGAQAFTTGNNVVFAEGKYQQGTTEGKKLIAHELTHVLQQRGVISGSILQEGIGHPGDKYEMEADQKAEQLLRQENTPSKVKPSVMAAPSLKSNDQGIFKKSVIQLFSGSAAAAYARTWAGSTNPVYGRFSNDCTNFVSQAMEAGGWTMIVGSSYCDDRKKNSVWWFKRDGCDRTWPIPNVHASHTWGGAYNFSAFVRESGRGTLAANVMDLNIGDVLQINYPGGGKKDHTMVVTQKTAANLYLSYHTDDHLDEPFYAEGSNPGILGRNPHPPNDYYGWKM